MSIVGAQEILREGKINEWCYYPKLYKHQEEHFNSNRATVSLDNAGKNML